MGSERPDYLGDTIEQRIGRYDRQVKKCTFVAGGLGAILVLMGLGGGGIEVAPHALKAWVVTLTVIAGGCVGWAQIQYTSSHNKLALIQEQVNKGHLPRKHAQDHQPYPQLASSVYSAAVVLLAIAGVLVIICAWSRPGNNPAESGGRAGQEAPVPQEAICPAGMSRPPA
ncbi:hypothetical protein [Arthrobacter mobilis]|uniref:Uncharacterized protein n=1 Tax=Arthrobacter mobilis TaxID=2724944 RepID=A0A7X6HC43_9MICC|nr:hypothetical protein [Arthrobacter mobilis]NKX54388.1 hypothetical protein [Arthrobacter mobilis]